MTSLLTTRYGCDYGHVEGCGPTAEAGAIFAGEENSGLCWEIPWRCSCMHRLLGGIESESFRKNTMATNPAKNSDDVEGKLRSWVPVCGIEYGWGSISEESGPQNLVQLQRTLFCA